MLKPFKRSRSNPLQPQSVNPRQGTVIHRSSAYQPSSTSWLSRHRLLAISLITVLTMLILGLTVYLSIFKWLVVEHIEITRQVNVQPNLVNNDQVENKTNDLYGTSLVLIDQQQLSQQIVEQLPAISTVLITRKFPNTLHIDYIPQNALAQLKAPQTTFLVNRQGYIFAEHQSDKLPQIITSDDKLRVGQTISAQGLALALQLIEGMRQTSPQIKTITLSDHQLELVLDKDPRILISQQQHPDTMVTIIHDLLYQFEQQQKVAKLVDLRFDRPVLQY